jgi:HD-like signal output (HDOD) protein
VSAIVDEELWYGSSTTEEAEERAAASLAGRVGRVLGAKPFPASALKLARLTRDPRAQMDELLAVLESDPALSARLLRLVNSAGFALRTSCTSVRHAAVLVGNARLNQVATTAAIMDMYSSSAKHATRVLEHATVVGALCRYLAFYLALPSDELFTCGFLHDIGKLMLLDTDGANYEQLLDEAGDEPDRVHLLERERFGFDHALLAGQVLAKWNIPDPVPQVVAWHHNAAHAFGVSSKLGQLVSAVRLADGMSYAFRAGKPEVSIELLAKTDAAQYLGVSEPQIAAMWDEMAALALRAITTSRSGNGVPETFSMRPSTSSLTVVRGALSAPPRRQASLAPSVPPVLVAASPSVEGEGETALHAVLSGQSTVPRAPAVLPSPTQSSTAAVSTRGAATSQAEVSTPIPPSLPAPQGGSWVPGESRVPTPPLPLPSVAPPPSPHPATSIRPTKLQPAAPEELRPEMAAISPKQYACIVCSGPTYAATCTACGAYVCPQHQLGDDAWCQLCVEEYAQYRLAGLPQWAILGLGCSYGLLIAVATFSSRGEALTRWTSTFALGATLALLVGVVRYGLRKSRFLRTRPERVHHKELAVRNHTRSAKEKPGPFAEAQVADFDRSDAAPSTLPGIVRQSELPLERIVPHVDVGIMHLQSLLRANPDNGTELEAQLAQTASGPQPSEAPAPVAALLRSVTPPPMNNAHRTAQQSPAPSVVEVDPVATKPEPVATKPEPVATKPEPRGVEAEANQTLTAGRAAALAAHRLGRSRGGLRRSFYKPRNAAPSWPRQSG